jgi:inosine/xanthosine triphosphatase
MAIAIKVATANPRKVKAIRKAFNYYFEDLQVESYEVNSGVPEQPVNEAVFTGAENRIDFLKERLQGDYDFLVSVEGGLLCEAGRWFNVQVVVVEDNNGKRKTGLSQGFQVPDKYVEKVMDTSLAEVFDELFDGTGGIRVLTKEHFIREDLIRDGTIMALSGLLHGEIW